MRLCECGCGKPAPIANRNRYDRGQRKGEPMRFVSGHNPTDHLNKGSPPGELNWNWKGENASYFAIHVWMNRKHPRDGDLFPL